MIKYLLLLFLFLNYVAFADDNKGASLGLTAGQTKGFAVGDYNLFDQDKLTFGIKRYGGGYSRLYIGNGVGLQLTAQGGVFLNDTPDSDIGMRVGAEPVGGRINLNTNSQVESYYQWLPMISAGPEFNLLGDMIYVALRAGGSVGNYGNVGILPYFHDAFGAGFYYDKYFAVTYTVIGDDYNTDIILQNDLFSFVVQDGRGGDQERSYLLLVRFGI